MAKKIEITEIVERVNSNKNFGIHEGVFFKYENECWKRLNDDEVPVEIRKQYDTDARLTISSGAIKEVMARMVQDPDLQIEFIDDTVFHYVNLENGVYDIRSEKLEDHKKEQAFSYKLNFAYVNKTENRKTPVFDQFVKMAFPEETKRKRKLLLQMLGYIISDCMGAKTAFFLIGESNSGKSTVLELLRTVVPENYISSVPLERLGNKFNLGKLSEARINICTELSEKSFTNVDVFKMMTSNEIVTGEYKGRTPFDFRFRCKSINAGNILPDIVNIDGFEAVLNRMSILLFPVSIPKNQQDVELLEKLKNEKNSIFSEAIDELVKLYDNGYCFETPEDTVNFKKQIASRGNVVEEFLADACVIEPQAKIHMCDIYEKFQSFCRENCIEVKVTKSMFLQKILRIKGLEHGKFRIAGSKPLAGIKGVRLKTRKEYISISESVVEEFNDGTFEQNKFQNDKEK